MRLRKPCEHGRYDDHRWWDADGSVFTCPGGEFLADDAAIELIAKTLEDARLHFTVDFYRDATAVLDALTLREGAE